LPESITFSVPGEPGSYALYLRLPAATQLAVGCLGTFHFQAGDYLYLGSARGPGGLKARLLHHARLTARPHWHIDWLRPHVILLGGWYSNLPGPLECEWSCVVSHLPGAAVPAPGFGAADCRHGCPAHLLMPPPGLQAQRLAHLLSSIGSRPSVAWFPPPETGHSRP